MARCHMATTSRLQGCNRCRGIMQKAKDVSAVDAGGSMVGLFAAYPML